MSEKKVIISIGGSVLVPGIDDASYIRRLAGLLRELSESAPLIVVCGGGRVSRYYSETGKALGGSEFQLDELGIGVTRLNAALLSIALGDGAAGVPATPAEAVAESQRRRIVVMGGTEPGHTTDAVAAMVAREAGARLIVNATSVDSVYSADPRADPGARRLPRLTIDELGALVYSEHGAGRSGVFDPLGVRIAKDCGIDIAIVDGRDDSEIRGAVLGTGIRGTYVDSRAAAPDRTT
ncbi:MAG: UMP kinase [Candidatus Methanoplasma sp.]|jgi:uridylate kinase|nr:UMP kinase [Candidatus Methanoplasma sp.]